MVESLRSSNKESSRPDRAALAKPAAWLHTMWMEGGQFESVVSQTAESPFGVPGVNHSECYPVTSEPLYRKTVIRKPRVRV